MLAVSRNSVQIKLLKEPMLFHRLLLSGATSHDILLNIAVLSMDHLMQTLLLRWLSTFLRKRISK